MRKTLKIMRIQQREHGHTKKTSKTQTHKNKQMTNTKSNTEINLKDGYRHIKNMTQMHKTTMTQAHK